MTQFPEKQAWSLLRRLLAHYRPRIEHLEALVTESAVRQAIEVEGHEAAAFSMWAVRRIARRKYYLYSQIFKPKDWTWLIFSPLPLPGQSEGNLQALGQLVKSLHGVTYVHWDVQGSELYFRAASLKTVEVGRRLTVNPSVWETKPPLTLPDWEARFDAEKWPGVSPLNLLSAVVESYYVEQRTAASKGAFTNLDLLVLDEPKPVIIEVKRRTERGNDESVGLSFTQYDTLQYLREHGFETHLVTRRVPQEVRASTEWLERGEWQSHSPRATFDRQDAMYEVMGSLPAPTLAALREARANYVPGPMTRDDLTLRVPLFRQEAAKQARRTERRERQHNQRQLKDKTGLSSLRKITKFSSPYDFLDPWLAAEVSMRGVTYGSAALTFLAARTEDDALRLQISQATSRSQALRLARQAPERAGWLAQRPEIAYQILRKAYRGERGRKLVGTLPFLLADSELLDPLLLGLQGQPGLQTLMQLRGELASQEIRKTGLPCCDHCAFARPSPLPGYLRCGHPEGVQASLECARQQAFEDPRAAGVALIAVTTRAGVHFKAR